MSALVHFAGSQGAREGVRWRENDWKVMGTAVDLSMTDQQGERENDIDLEYEGHFLTHVTVCKVQFTVYCIKVATIPKLQG